MRFCPRENKAGTHCIGICVGPGIRLDVAENKKATAPSGN
jgi:hypothetical protein